MRILVLDDDAARHDAFDNALGAHELDHAWTYFDAVSLLHENVYDLVYLDHDLNDFESSSLLYEPGEQRVVRELTGLDVARFIARQIDADKQPARVIVHSWNPAGAASMVNMLRDAGVQSVYEPFRA